MSEIAKALVAVQSDLPDVGKDKTADVKNNEGKKLYSYKYADLSSISEAVLPLLAECGLAWVTAPGLNADGKFVLSYKLLHVGGEVLSGEYPLPTNGTPQQQGSAITYARRYALCAVVGVVPEDDDDGAAASRKPKTVNLKPYIAKNLSPAEASLLRENWIADGYSFKADAVPEHREQEIRTLIGSFVGLDDAAEHLGLTQDSNS